MAQRIAIMMGMSSWMSLETSSRITVREIVIRVTPPSMPAAPTSAYSPGSTPLAPIEVRRRGAGLLGSGWLRLGSGWGEG